MRDVLWNRQFLPSRVFLTLRGLRNCLGARRKFRVLQKELGKRSSITFFRFRDLWCFCHFFVTFAKLLLPDSFVAGWEIAIAIAENRAISVHSRPKDLLLSTQQTSRWTNSLSYQLGNRTRGHYERGLLTERISRISKKSPKILWNFKKSLGLSLKRPLGLIFMQKCVVKFRCNLIWNLKFLMWNIWWNSGVRLFDLPRKHQKFRGEFRGKFRQNFRKLRFKFHIFFGNFVQQKGGRY